ncbi:structural constituent of cell wall [Rhizoctonia solani]|uniref:Structural constituent of cell wall n=1 Tax=Rhizoctonia solani TaxID=456999 RepID=A0A8H7IC96_9AGAM|nr:structural constituent of cell wall [Rhizoctonia solani]
MDAFWISGLQLSALATTLFELRRKMSINIFAISTVALAAVTVSANHAVSFTNNCGSSIRPIIKNTANGVTYTGPWLSKGQGSSSSWPSGIIVGQTNANQGNDCVGCTRLECDFANSNPSFHCCQLSREAGFHIGMSFSWTEGGCKGDICKSASCPLSGPWYPWPVDDGSSLHCCPTANVGLKITFCP